MNFSHKMIIDIPISLNIIKSISIGLNCKLTEQDLRQIFLINGINEIEIKKSKLSLYWY